MAPRSAATAPLNVGKAPGLPMFRQPQTPSSPQEPLTQPPAGLGPDQGPSSPQSGTQSPGLWTPNAATPPTDDGLQAPLDSEPHESADEYELPSDARSNASEGSSRTSSRAEPLSPKEIRANKAGIKPVIGQAFTMGTTFAYQGLARDDFEREVGVYLADADDVENISDPAAGLLSRRMPAGADNPDLADGIGLLFALFGYVAKQLSKLTEAKRLQARALTFAPDQGEPEPSGQGWPLQSPAPQTAPTEGAA